MTEKTAKISQKSALALLPLGLFILIFLGSGIFFHLNETPFAFYQISAPVAILPAIILAVILSSQRLEKTIDSFLKGIGDTNIMAMCMIYLLAGGFSFVAKETGGVDATVNLALDIIPSGFILPGIFIVGAFISTAMGTSMGTIAAVAPIALGIAQKTGIPLPLMAGTVLGGAMFGDNLSIISDTTIAATRTQGCNMNFLLQLLQFYIFSLQNREQMQVFRLKNIIFFR
jgi:Na+/H+ antiporter NhaC